MTKSEKPFAGRPPRLEQIFSAQPLYFVTFNSWQRSPLLANESVHTAFCEYAEKNLARGAAVGRYVIMPDHIHLFVRIGHEGQLTTFIRLLKQTLSRTLKESGSKPPYWQPGFFDHLLRGSDSYSEKWNYVRMNPVRAELVQSPEEWPFQGEIEIIRY